LNLAAQKGTRQTHRWKITFRLNDSSRRISQEEPFLHIQKRDETWETFVLFRFIPFLNKISRKRRHGLACKVACSRVGTVK
jgi:hypothetical protein